MAGMGTLRIEQRHLLSSLGHIFFVLHVQLFFRLMFLYRRGGTLLASNAKVCADQMD
jgi:hypothetical protein